MSNQSDGAFDYECGVFRDVVYECLKAEGLEKLIFKYPKHKATHEEVHRLLKIVKKKAMIRNSNGTLEILHFAGLIY